MTLPSPQTVLQGVILLDTHGESCDTGEEGGGGGGLTWVGAEVRAGKSSLRSKQKNKKVRRGRWDGRG